MLVLKWGEEKARTEAGAYGSVRGGERWFELMIFTHSSRHNRNYEVVVMLVCACHCGLQDIHRHPGKRHGAGLVFGSRSLITLQFLLQSHNLL